MYVTKGVAHELLTFIFNFFILIVNHCVLTLGTFGGSLELLLHLYCS
jgi:hypothetical protein